MKYTEDNIVGVEFTSGAYYYRIADLKDGYLWFESIDVHGKAIKPSYKWDTLEAFNRFVGSSFRITKEASDQLYQIY